MRIWDFINANIKNEIENQNKGNRFLEKHKNLPSRWSNEKWIIGMKDASSKKGNWFFVI